MYVQSTTHIMSGNAPTKIMTDGDARVTRSVNGSLLFCQTWEAALFYLFLAFVLVGGLNWFLVGAANWNLVTAITAGRQGAPANAASRVVYTLVGVFTVALLVMIIVIGAQRQRC